MSRRVGRVAIAVLGVSVFCCVGSWPDRGLAESGNLVFNGDFEQDADHDGVPDGWQTAGRREIQQTLSLDRGRDGGHAAKLSCSRFVGGSPDSHVMLCQVGRVSVRAGQWYRLTFWAKQEGMERPVCEVAVSNTRPWYSSGVHGSFVVSRQWRRVEILARAERDVAAETSRLQFWFRGTGTLWLDDVVLEPVTVVQQLHPSISVDGVANPVPNSSFECGAGGWGSYSPSITTWSGNVYRLEGVVDESVAWHGRRSLRLSVDKKHPLVFLWDYFDPAVQPVETLLAAHEGWIPVQPGKPYVFTCYARADRSDVPVRLLAFQPGARRFESVVTVGTEWQRCRLRFTPRTRFVWLAAGPDLSRSDKPAATVWLDAFQLDSGKQPQPYQPRASVESTVTTPAVGNVFVEPDKGLTVHVHFYNGTDSPRTVSGRLVVTDFFDREVLSRTVECRLEPRSGRRVELAGLLPGRRGFFRVHWQPRDHTPPFPQTLRCAVIDPYRFDDSPFGMNHAFPWDFLLRLSRQAGLTWMRDWSAKWHTVEPQPGKWDFSLVDPQIDRVVRNGLNPLLLLPFPSAEWSSAADPKVIAEYARGNPYHQRRSVVACMPKDLSLFRQYVGRTVRRYADRARWVEILNEPLYTTYSVPARFGYDLDDYLTLLRNAHQAIKAVDPNLKVIGGIGTWVDRDWVQRFIDADGLRWCDAMDVHLYAPTIPPELFEPQLAATWQKMKSRRQAKPIWLTEFGCYADDDPYQTPGRIGDQAMSRSNWPSEREAAEALVQTAAVFLSHGLRKIFFHAGTCGPINGRNGGNVFFEYGGAPRKMYPALSALANLLGPDPEPVATSGPKARLRVYVFRTTAGAVAVVWQRGERPVTLQLPDGVTARDLMGNPLTGRDVRVTSTPTYLLAQNAQTLQKWLLSEPTP